MNDSLFHEVCILYGLGDLKMPPQSVSGGFLHAMWRIETSQGTFAVKELSPRIMQKPGIYDEFTRSESIAMQLAEQGIPAVTALSANGKTIQNISGTFVIVYPWIEGKVLSTDPASEAQCETIGRIIGQIHNSNLGVTHGDIDQKNVIWTDNGTMPHVIDWEGVGDSDPSVEIVSTALNWAGIASGTVDVDCINAVMEGYKSTGAVLKESPEIALNGCLKNWEQWLTHNMNQSTSLESTHEQKAIAGQQIQETSRTIALIKGNFEVWGKIFSRYQ